MALAMAAVTARPAAAQDTQDDEPRGALQPTHAHAVTAPAENVREPAADESVYVVQRRAYSKSGKVEITPLFMTAVNPKFVGYLGVGIAFAYHFRENLALEFMTSIYQLAFYSDLVFEVWRYEDLTPEEVDLKQMLYFNSLNLQFSALYGKLEFYGYLVDYDFFVAGGLGLAITREPCFAGTGSCSEVVDVGRGLQFPGRFFDLVKITGNLGGGVRVFFHEMVGARIEFRTIVYADRKVEETQSATQGQTTTDIRNTMMIMLGVSLML